MRIPEHRKWMDNRLLPGRAGYTDEFINGMEEFIAFACRQQKYISEGVIRCPCERCKNMHHLMPDEVTVHLFRRGFTSRYWYWTSHGEEAPRINLTEYDNSGASNSHQGSEIGVHSSNQNSFAEENYEHVNRYQSMVYDAAGLEFRHQVEPNVEKNPNMDAAKFYNMLDYTKFGNKKQELIASQSASMDQGDSTSQPSQLSENDIWVQSVGGKKKGRVPGLGSLGRTINVHKQSTSIMSEEFDEMIKPQVHASNAELHAQLQEGRRQIKKIKKESGKIRKELRNTNDILASLMEHVGYTRPSKE